MKISQQVCSLSGYILNEEIKPSIFSYVMSVWSWSLLQWTYFGGITVWKVVWEMSRILDYQNWLPGQVTERQ